MLLRLNRGAAIALLLVGAVAVFAMVVSPVGRAARAAVDRCGAPSELVALGEPLPRTAERLRAGKPLTIVALGSSSTYGTGASQPQNSYPSRLGALLQAQFPGIPVRVINRGVGGETATSMASRIETEVLPEAPDLVIWQVGTNSVLRDEDPTVELEAVRNGIARMKAAGADVMLMDLQYAPAVLLHARYREMLHALAATARNEEVPIFHRFAIMRSWAEDGRMPLPVMLAVDRLHMTDTSYDCLARQVGAAITGATGRGI
jgi:acyl-CoA thioesterase-1